MFDLGSESVNAPRHSGFCVCRVGCGMPFFGFHFHLATVRESTAREVDRSLASSYCSINFSNFSFAFVRYFRSEQNLFGVLGYQIVKRCVRVIL